MNVNEMELASLRSRLLALDEIFAHELRVRGFDPEQADNVPLTPALERLRIERQDLIAQLAAADNEGNTTMNEIERIQDQLKRAFEGGAWHGPAVRDLLRDVTAAQAASRPVKGAHTIWELTLHIAAWEKAGVRRLSGDRAELPDEEDWLVIKETGEDEWNSVKQLLEHGHQELRAAIGNVNPDRLDEPILEGMSTVYVTLQGIIQHDLYHAGQIAILKKALTETKQ